VSQKLELTPETIEYCMELEGKLKNMQSELDAAANELKTSFRAKADRLGVHSDIFEEWVDSAKMSMDKNAECKSILWRTFDDYENKLSACLDIVTKKLMPMDKK